MTGWRCGFVAGNEQLVKAYGAVKDNTDSGQFLAIQNASAYALRPSGNHRGDRRQIFPPHGLLSCRCCAGWDFEAEKPRGSFFLYVPAPKSAQPVGGGEEVTFARPRLVRNG